MNTKSKILEIIKNYNHISVEEISSMVSISKSMLHRYLKNLLEENLVEKSGTPPKVYYFISTKTLPSKCVNQYGFDSITGLPCTEIKKEYIDIINENFTLFEPSGIELEGLAGFLKWCEYRKYNVNDKVEEYINSLKEYDQFTQNGFINATTKVEQTFKKENFLNGLFYLYPYSLAVFGKTKMGQWLFNAKKTQDKKLMKKTLSKITPKIRDFISIHNIDAIGFVPPTVPRKIQLMKEIEKEISTNLSVIKIEKIRTKIIVEQKSLKNIQERVINAESTMVVKTRNQTYDNVLLIDDFTGSGSTLNVISRKIKEQNKIQKVIGLTIAGSMNGFEVVKEV